MEPQVFLDQSPIWSYRHCHDLRPLPVQDAIAIRGSGAKIKELELLGALVFIGAIVCLLLEFQWGGTTYPWRDLHV